MYVKYANEKEICQTLAKYKIGEHVTMLKSKTCDTGILEKGTEMIVKNIVISDKMELSHIPDNQLHNYEIMCDEFAFRYYLADASDHKPNAEEHMFSSQDFEHCKSNLSPKDMRLLNKQKRRRKRHASILYYLKLIGMMLTPLFTALIIGCIIILISIMTSGDVRNAVLISVILNVTALISFAPILTLLIDTKCYDICERLASNHCICKKVKKEKP